MTIFSLIRKDKYYFLLSSQLLFAIVLAFLKPIGAVTDLVVSVGLSVVLITCLNILDSGKIKFRLGVSLAVLFVGLTTATQFHAHPLLFFFTFLAFFVLFVMVDFSIIRMLLRIPEVTASLISGSISGYLLMATSYAFFLVAMMGFIPNMLNKPLSEIGFQGALYFSITTLTSIGFGDIAPVHPLAQTTSALLGVAGQFYMAVVVAVIVGKYMRRR